MPCGPAVSYDHAGPFRCFVGWIGLSAYLSPSNRIPSAHSSVPFIAFWVFWNRLQDREIHTVAEALRKNKIRNTFSSLGNDHAILRRRVSHIYSKASPQISACSSPPSPMRCRHACEVSMSRLIMELRLTSFHSPLLTALTASPRWSSVFRRSSPLL